MNSVVLVISILFIVEVLRSLFKVNLVVRRMATENEKFHSSNSQKLGTRFVVILPVLNEQDRIIETIRYFLAIIPQNSAILVVGTVRENPSDHAPSTIAHARAALSAPELANVQFIIDPRAYGRMAHQVNWALNHARSNGFLSDGDYICLYNADSRPHLQTFSAISQIISSSRSPSIIQQSSIFFNNISSISYLAKAVAFYQSTWTLNHEISRIYRQWNCIKFLRNFINTHVVGHGLFVRVDCLWKIGLFPENTLTEDVYFGYLAKCYNFDIANVFLLENADSPSSLKSALRQKRIWFWGPMLYPYYFLSAWWQIKPSRLGLCRFGILAVSGLYNAIRWLFCGPLLLFLLVTLITSRDIDGYARGFAAIAIVSYVTLPVLIFALVRERLVKLTPGTPLPTKITAIASIPALAIHAGVNSLPPIGAVWDLFNQIITGHEASKPKTE